MEKLSMPGIEVPRKRMRFIPIALLPAGS